MMIRVDIAEIEILTNLLVKMSSDAEEYLSKLRQIAAEMHDDLELPSYPQTPGVLEAVSFAIDSVNRGNDTLQTLKNVMLPVATAYQENEQMNKNALARLTVKMDTAAVGFSAAVSPSGITPVEHSDSIVSQAKVEQLVSDSVLEMQLTNIAAVSKAVKEDYEVSSIADLIENS